MSTLLRHLWLVSILFVASCAKKEEIVSGLGREELVNVLSILESSAIPYERRSTAVGRADSFSVWVDSNDFLPALTLLKGNGLLTDSSSDFEQLSKQQGFVPQARSIEQLKEDRLLSLDLERLVRNLSGVLEVRAVVRNVSDSDDSKSASRTATLVIRYTSKSGVQPYSNEELSKLAAAVVPGLKPDSITISSNRIAVSDENKPRPVRVVSDISSSVQAKLWLVVIAALVLVLMIGLMFGFMLREKLIAWKVIGGDSNKMTNKTGVHATLSRLPTIKS